jgi:glycine dehydrogenase
MIKNQNQLDHSDTFFRRHVGPKSDEIQWMLKELRLESIDQLIKKTIPEKIRFLGKLDLGLIRSEYEVLHELKKISQLNQVFRSFIGMGYSECIAPAIILRNIFENPGWYTQYTPYQAEIAQGRLEALLNFQTMIIDLTELPVTNASMLDEGTAAAEAMSLCFHVKGTPENGAFFVSESCHPQTIAVLRTRAEPLGIHIIVGNHTSFDFSHEVFGAMLQYPATCGKIFDYREFISHAHSQQALVVVAADLLSLALLTSPGAMGADIAVGSAQRFGVPLGYGGPHAAYFATREDFKRLMPGRIVGVSKDVQGKSALRLALQTREQHIRRDKATSNICTSQVLLAVISSMYAVYHGPSGIRQIAERVRYLAVLLKNGLSRLGMQVCPHPSFDTVRLLGLSSEWMTAIEKRSKEAQINFRPWGADRLIIALDEATSEEDLNQILRIFAQVIGKHLNFSVRDLAGSDLEVSYFGSDLPAALVRQTPYLTHPVFNSYHSETEMLRYIFRLQSRDLSLTTSMIPLGSCTMKLNATSEMIPVSWPEFGNIHPFAPIEQTRGYQLMLKQLEEMLMTLTGFSGVSLQPNAGSQGEYAGLLVIRKYHQSRGDGRRNVCLIPKSAHGTNPASATMAGMQVVVIECDRNGNVDLNDLKLKAQEFRSRLSAVMITYPSTHGVFEESVGELCSIIHENGGQVYMDGANMNAQIGLCRPGDFGPDVCHLNLHKTFCIPHGGGGPGMGPIAVAKHLVPFLPTHPSFELGSPEGIGPVSSAPWGSASILPIPWMYIQMMGAEGLRKATELAILNANYVCQRLKPYYPVLYIGTNGYIAHECIFDFRSFKESAGIEVEDVAKRLMDYGFHAPTVSFPVAGTMMIEPTESESKGELDRFCDAMISIREEIREIETGKADRVHNLLKNAPHTASRLMSAEWNFAYSKERAAFPAPWLKEHKYWPFVSRINNVLGDRNLICACVPIEDYQNR